MKLIYCSSCKDLFKLTSYEKRKCRCGQVTGKYLSDRKRAKVSKNAISIAIGNKSLKKAIEKMNKLWKKHPEADRESDIKNSAISKAWVRPNRGPGNPRTKVY